MANGLSDAKMTGVKVRREPTEAYRVLSFFLFFVAFPTQRKTFKKTKWRFDLGAA